MPDTYNPNQKFLSITLAFLMAVGLLFGFGLERYGLFDVDEAIFTQASVEMLHSGDYVTPTYNSTPRYHKPPLIYWLQSASMQQFGVSPWAARLPSAILGFLTVLVFIGTLSAMTGSPRYALTSGAILAFSLSFVALARSAVADMAFIFLSLSATMMLLGNLYRIQNSIANQIIAGFLLGGALLAKGPVGLVMPFFAVGFTVLFKEGFKYNLKRVNPFIIIPAILLALVPWCAMIIQAHGMAFFHEFIIVHNLERFFGGFGNTHSSSPFYYVVVLLIGFFPWILFTPSALAWIAPTFVPRLHCDSAQHALPAIGLLWAVSVVVLFSFSATKLAHYIVPALPGAALFIAGRLTSLNEDKLGKLHLLLVLPFAALFAFLFVVLKWLPGGLLGEGALVPLLSWLSTKGMEWPLTDPQLVAVLGQNIPLGVTPVIIGAILLVGTIKALVFMSSGHRYGIFVMAVSNWMVLMLISIAIVPAVYAYMQQPLARIAEKLAAHAEHTPAVYYVELHHPSIRFISGVPFTALDSVAQLKEMPLEEKNYLVVEYNKLDKTLAALPPAASHTSDCQGGYCLVEVSVKSHRNENFLPSGGW